MLLGEVIHVPIGASLATISALLGGSVAASLLRPRAEVLPAPGGGDGAHADRP
jgi:hypothetical protein